MGKLRKGTSIIEAVIAIALIGIILIFSITAYSNVSKQSKSSEDIEIASTLASQKIEEIKGYNYSQLSSSTAFPINGTYGNYSYSITADNGSSGNGVYIRGITVKVYRTGSSTLIIQMDCNFLRSTSDGKNAGL